MPYTNSSIKTFRQCPRKYYLKYECGLRKIHNSTSAPLRIGTAIHKALEMHLVGTAQDGQNAMESYYLGEMANAATPDEHRTISYELAYCSAIFKAYQNRWADSPLKMISTEVEMQYRDFWIKCDGIGILPEDMWYPDRVTYVEHKTVSKSIDQTDYITNLIMDMQISSYMDVMRKNGINVMSTYYDIIVKPDFKIKEVPVTDNDGVPVVKDADGNRAKNKDGSWKTRPDSSKGWVSITRTETHTEHYERVLSEISQEMFQRIEIPRPDEQLDSVRFEILDTIMDIYGCQDRKFWRRNTENCSSHFGQMCPYYHLCCANKTEFQSPPDEFEKISNPHVELDFNLNKYQETVKCLNLNQ